MKKVLSIILVAMLCGIAYSASAQYCTVSGRITDENGEPMAGVTIQEKGTTIGTTTDENGNFSINVPCDAILVISYLGYKSVEIPLSTLKSKSSPVVILEEEELIL
jgi:hypothetical protein